MISVVMSTYNGSKYIIDQLDSVRKQSVSPDEVIIADDCSSDNTYEIIVDYIKEYNLDWHLIKNNSNFGWRKSFANVLSMAKGDYIFPADQDDIWKTDKIEIMTKTMDNNPNILLLCGNYKSFYYNDIPTDDSPGSLSVKKIEFSKKWSYIQRPGCVFCCRKEIISDMVKCWCEGYAHDVLLWQLALCQDSLFLLDYNTIYFRRHDNNATPRNRHDRKTKLDMLNQSIKNNESLSKIVNNNVRFKNHINCINEFFDFEKHRIDFVKDRKFLNVFWLLLHLGYYSKGILSFGVDVKCALTK